MALRMAFSFALVITLLGPSVSKDVGSYCGKTKLVCGSQCGDEFCEFPDYCGNPTCKRCTKTRKTCREVLEPCGIGLKCMYNEKCVTSTCAESPSLCEGVAGKVSFCLPLDREEFDECKEVERMRCVGINAAGLPRPEIIARYAPKAIEGWKVGDRCGVAYCPKGRGCMNVKETSCVGKLEECGEIDCPPGYECVDEPACEHTCDPTAKDACIKVDLRFDEPAKTPKCERVPDCGE